MCGVDFLPGSDLDKLQAGMRGGGKSELVAEEFKQQTEPKIRLIIAGGRKFNDKDLFNKGIEEFVSKNGQPDEVICGMAKGADTMGWLWAKEVHVPVVECPANWERYGYGAGPARNRQMAKLGTHLLAFWDGQSSGTWSMINLARDKGLEVKVIGY